MQHPDQEVDDLVDQLTPSLVAIEDVVRTLDRTEVDCDTKLAEALGQQLALPEGYPAIPRPVHDQEWWGIGAGPTARIGSSRKIRPFLDGCADKAGFR